MRRLALVFALAFPLPASADCAADVAALFQGGPLDPFERPNRREVTMLHSHDGPVTQVSDVLWDGVTRSINCTETLCAMQVGTEMWIKPQGMDDWMSAPSQLPEDPETFARAIADDMAANLSEAECLGPNVLDGRDVSVFRYRTKTNPNEFDAWFGGLFIAFIAADTGQLIRLEELESVSSFAPEPGLDLRVTDITYDDSISISEPEG